MTSKKKLFRDDRGHIDSYKGTIWVIVLTIVFSVAIVANHFIEVKECKRLLNDKADNMLVLAKVDSVYQEGNSHWKVIYSFIISDEKELINEPGYFNESPTSDLMVYIEMDSLNTSCKAIRYDIDVISEGKIIKYLKDGVLISFTIDKE